MLHVVIGRRETGKTTLTMFLARQTRQRLIFDPRNGIYPGANGLKVTTITELVEHGMPTLLQDDVLEVVFSPRTNDLGRAFLVWSNQVKRWIEQHPSRPLAIVIDESALLKRALDQENHPIQAAMRWCPRDRIHFYLTCHRPVDVPTDIRAIADFWILFHCNQEHDLDVIEQRCGEVVRREVVKLPPYDFVIWDDARAELKRPALKPHQWFVELGGLRDPRPVPIERTTQSTIDTGKLWK